MAQQAVPEGRGEQADAAFSEECKSLKVSIDDTDEVHYACSSQGLPPLFSLSVKLLPQLQMPVR